MSWQSDGEHEGHAERLPGGWRGRCDCGWSGPSHVTATMLDPDLPAAVEEAIRREWAAHLPPASLRALRQAAAAARIAQEHLEAAVCAARDDGRSWADIGSAVGITRQTAHERWGKTTAAPATFADGLAAMAAGVEGAYREALLWADDVRQGAENRLGVGLTDERAWEDPAYSAALDTLRALDEATARMHQAHAKARDTLTPQAPGA